jgi:hypothetical protein
MASETLAKREGSVDEFYGWQRNVRRQRKELQPIVLQFLILTLCGLQRLRRDPAGEILGQFANSISADGQKASKWEFTWPSANKTIVQQQGKP